MKKLVDVFGIVCVGLAVVAMSAGAMRLSTLSERQSKDPYETWNRFEYTHVDVYTTCEDDKISITFPNCKSSVDKNGALIVRERIEKRQDTRDVARFNINEWCSVQERWVEK